MSSNIKLFELFPNEVFVETGTYSGDGVRCAISCGFENIRSVELSKKFYRKCKEKFKNNPEVHLFLGTSEDCLWDMIHDVDTNITFWLDAHFSKGRTQKGPELCPLLKELDIISKHSIKTHTIIIDDVRDIGTPNFGDITLDKVFEAIMKINSNYNIRFYNGVVKDDILVTTI